jgi:hypothetical protein
MSALKGFVGVARGFSLVRSPWPHYFSQTHNPGLS